MNVKDLVASMTPDVYRNVKRALELGKWPDGKRLSAEQKQHCMDMVILYEHHQGLNEQDRTGYINRNKVEKTPCASSSSAESSSRQDETVDVVKIVTTQSLH